MKYVEESQSTVTLIFSLYYDMHRQEKSIVVLVFIMSAQQTYSMGKSFTAPSRNNVWTGGDLL